MSNPSAPDWKHVSFALVLPYHPDWATHAIVENGDGAKAGRHKHSTHSYNFHPWFDVGVARNLNHWKNPYYYHNSKKIAHAAIPQRHAAWEGAEVTPPQAPEAGADAGTTDTHDEPAFAGLQLVGAERSEFDHPKIGYAILHFASGDVTSDQFQALCAHLRRPTDVAPYNEVLARMGIGAELQRGGFLTAPTRATGVAAVTRTQHRDRRSADDTPDTSEPLQILEDARREPPAKRVYLHRNSGRTFVLTHAVPTSAMGAKPSMLADHSAWTAEQAWSYFAAVGITANGFFRRPGHSEEQARRGTFEADLYHMRAASDGLAAIGHPDLVAPDPTSPEAPPPLDLDRRTIQILLHGRLLDMCLLALRQRAWLDAHCEDLAALPQGSLGEKLDSLKARESSLALFRNQVWFTDIPGRSEATTLLNAQQGALNCPAMLADVVDEQKDLMRQSNLLRNEEELERAKKEAERQRSLDEKAKDLEEQAKKKDAETQKRTRAIELVIAFTVPYSLVLATGAMFENPDLSTGFRWLLIAVTITCLAVIVYHATWSRSSDSKPE